MHVLCLKPEQECRSEDEDAVIDRLVRQLNALGRMATINFACHVGKLVMDSLYSGDPDAWRSRNSRKHVSFRKLSRHPDLPMSAPLLYRSVCIYEICQRFGVKSWRHVSVSHIRLVLPLSVIDQERLLREAEGKAWSVRRLEEEIAPLRDAMVSAQGNDRGGRRRLDRLRKAMVRVKKCSTALDELIAAEMDGLAGPEVESANSAVDLFDEIAHKCRTLTERLAAALEQRDSVSPPRMAYSGAETGRSRPPVDENGR